MKQGILCLGGPKDGERVFLPNPEHGLRCFEPDDIRSISFEPEFFDSNRQTITTMYEYKKIVKGHEIKEFLVHEGYKLRVYDQVLMNEAVQRVEMLVHQYYKSFGFWKLIKMAFKRLLKSNRNDN